MDGNTNQAYPGASCTHTQNHGQPWWRLALGAAKSIDRVEVWNRSDCCSNRLNGVQVKVDLQLCGTLSAAKGKQSVSCGGKSGSTVELKMPRSDYLTLCEVKVYGSAGGTCDGDSDDDNGDGEDDKSDADEGDTDDDDSHTSRSWW